MQEIGMVVETKGRFATVEVRRKSACEGCHQHAEGCSACSIFISDAKHRVSVENEINAKIGDRVVLEATTERVLSYAVLVFIVPLVVACIFYLFSIPFFSSSELPRIGIAAIGMLLSYAIIGIISHKLETVRRSVSISKILTSSEINDDHYVLSASEDDND